MARHRFEGDENQLALLKSSVTAWNNWRTENHNIKPKLSGAYLSGANLNRANLSDADLSGADLRGANLSDADLSGANLRNAILGNADLSRANLAHADLTKASAEFNTAFMQANLTGAKLWEVLFKKTNLRKANLTSSDFMSAFLWQVDFSEANLTNAVLQGVDLIEANLSRTIIKNVELSYASIIDTIIEESYFSNCRIYGISAWNLQGNPKHQSNLIITHRTEPKIIVDDIEVAQFIYLILKNQKIRNFIDTVAKKAVLILGRFSSERKKVLDAIREKLRDLGYLPILFDFEKPKSQTFIETVNTLANMCRFIIADFTDSRAVLEEVPRILMTVTVPLQPLIQKGSGSLPSTLYNLQVKYENQLLDVFEYIDEKDLLLSLEEKIIKSANNRAEKLLDRKLFFYEKYKNQ